MARTPSIADVAYPRSATLVDPIFLYVYECPATQSSRANIHICFFLLERITNRIMYSECCAECIL